jgi:DNA polymerase-3 subunit chi
MTRIDFYLVRGDELLFACRLISLIYRKGHKIHVQTSSIEYAKSLDEKLWSFSEDSFIPHSLKEDQLNAPIKICTETDSPEHKDVFVNLSGSTPIFFSRFDRVAEVVPEKESDRSAARKAYSFYKERGYEVRFHEMGRKSR